MSHDVTTKLILNKTYFTIDNQFEMIKQSTRILSKNILHTNYMNTKLQPSLF